MDVYARCIEHLIMAWTWRNMSKKGNLQFYILWYSMTSHRSLSSSIFFPVNLTQAPPWATARAPGPAGLWAFPWHCPRGSLASPRWSPPQWCASRHERPDPRTTWHRSAGRSLDGKITKCPVFFGSCFWKQVPLNKVLWLAFCSTSFSWDGYMCQGWELSSQRFKKFPCVVGCIKDYCS